MPSSATTQLVHSSAPVALDTDLVVMEELVMVIM